MAVSSTPLPVASNDATTVTTFNSTTLPPGLDATVLDGGELVTVETRAATHRDGQTSVSYTIVVKKGDLIETMEQPVFNTTDPALVLRTDSPSTASSATTGAWMLQCLATFTTPIETTRLLTSSLSTAST